MGIERDTDFHITLNSAEERCGIDWIKEPARTHLFDNDGEKGVRWEVVVGRREWTETLAYLARTGLERLLRIVTKFELCTSFRGRQRVAADVW